MSKVTATNAPALEEWTFLGVRVRLLSEPDAPLVIAETVLPVGASPPLHLHEDLDDSFYILEGNMVIRCGDEICLGTAGTWVPFPRGVPHTFRVIDRPASVLLVHTNDSFMAAVRAIGRPVHIRDDPTTIREPGPDELTSILADHGIRNVGQSMNADEAERWMQQLDVRHEPRHH